MIELLQRVWQGHEGQDIAEYAVMLAVILVIVVGTIRLIGSEANNTFPQSPAISAKCRSGHNFRTFLLHRGCWTETRKE